MQPSTVICSLFSETQWTTVLHPFGAITAAELALKGNALSSQLNILEHALGWI